MIHDGLNGGGSVDVVLSKDIGEKNFKLGKANDDFPVAPAIHVAISGGTYQHLRTVHTLLLAGANMNLYYYEKRKKSRPFPVYHPGIYYGTGGFGTPNSGHAGLLQSIFVSYPDKYNHSRVQEWVRITGTPPPLHVSIMRGYFDGAYLLATMPTYDKDMKDAQGLSALHVAAWLGNSDIIALLIHNGADFFAVDRYNRTFLHYVAMRGLHTLAVRMITNHSAIPHEAKVPLLEIKDADGRTALDMALLPPAQMGVVSTLKHFLENATQTSLLIRNDTTSNMPSSGELRTFSNSFASDLTTGWISSSCAANLASAVRWGNATALSSRKIWSAVDVLHVRNMSSARSFYDFYTTQRPLLIRGNATSSMLYWIYGSPSRDAFLRAYGNLPVNVSAGCGAEEAASGRCFGGMEASALLRDYLQRHEAQVCMMEHAKACRDDQDTCAVSTPNCCNLLPEQNSVATSVLPSDMIRSDFSLSREEDYFQVCLKESLPGNVYLRAAVGKVVSTPLSASTAAWNVLLVGEKRHWYLLSPGAAVIATDENMLFANTHPQEWVKSVFVKLRRRRLAVEVIQFRGDVVFIPHGWYFLSISAGEVIDLTNHFCILPGNVSVFEQIPTGIRVYGNRQATNSN